MWVWKQAMARQTAGSIITIRREELNSELCELLKNELLDVLSAFPHESIPLPPEARPQRLPSGSVFLVAEQAGENDSTDTRTPDPHPELLGCLAVIPHPPHSPNARNLPPAAKVGEVKRVFVRPAHQRKGIAGMLLEAAEDIARTELGLDLLVLETEHATQAAQKAYEAYGWKRRGVYGLYDERDSVCYEKWL